MEREVKVILVDEEDRELGTMDKMEAHQRALLHRAVSVFITNSKGEWLLQRRALDKYHSKGLWTNTCCSHPVPGETAADAAIRRLMEEMGLISGLTHLFSFIYREKLDNGLTEYEYDHVFHGTDDDLPVPDHQEVLEWKYLSFSELKEDVAFNPDNYTVWFRKIFERVHQMINND